MPHLHAGEVADPGRVRLTQLEAKEKEGQGPARGGWEAEVVGLCHPPGPETTDVPPEEPSSVFTWSLSLLTGVTRGPTSLETAK